MVLYLYSAFLLLFLMTTQSTLQYSFTFTHSYSASIRRTLLFYGGHSGFSIFPKDTSACRWVRLGIKLPNFRLGDDHSTPQPQPPM